MGAELGAGWSPAPFVSSAWTASTEVPRRIASGGITSPSVIATAVWITRCSSRRFPGQS